MVTKYLGIDIPELGEIPEDDKIMKPSGPSCLL